MAKKPTEINEEFTVEVPSTGYVQQEVTPVTTSEVSVSVEEPRPTELHYEFQTTVVPTTPAPTERRGPGVMERLRSLVRRAREAIEGLMRRREGGEATPQPRTKEGEAGVGRKAGVKAPAKPIARPRPRVALRVPAVSNLVGGGSITLPSLWEPVTLPVIAGGSRAVQRRVGARPVMPNLGIGVSPSPWLPSVIAPVRVNPRVMGLIGYQARPVGMPAMWVGMRTNMPMLGMAPTTPTRRKQRRV